MTPTWFYILCQISVFASGVVAGVFLTFSDFVMRSLGKTATAGGIEVMQIINREVFRTVFMVLLLGMSAISVFLIGYAYLNLSGSASTLIIAGGGLYFVGVFMVSLVFNVPMNQRLDGMDYNSEQASTYWSRVYLPRWTFWNYIRATTAAASAICLLAALQELAQGV